MPTTVNPKKVLVLLIGEILEDPRAYRTCMSLCEYGAIVTVACTNPSQRPENEKHKELNIIRFPHTTVSLPRKIYDWLQSRLHPGVGQVLARGHEEVPKSFLKAALRNFVLNLNYSHFMRSTRKINQMMASAFDGESFDLAHCNDLDTLFAGIMLKRKDIVRELLYDSHEYWSGIGVHGSRPNEALRKIEASCISNADYVVTVNGLIAEHLEKQYNLKKIPSVVMNCSYRYHGELHCDTVNSPVRVVYQGKLQAFRGLAELVEAFKYIDGAVLTLSGYGPLEESLKLLTDAQGLSEKVIFTGRYYPGEVMSLLAKQDIGIHSSRDVTLNIHFASPNKFFDYAMAGLAVASSDLPFMTSKISNYGMGRIFKRIDPESIAKTLNEMIADTNLLKKYKKNARKAALDTFCWEEQFWKNYPWKP